MLRFTSGSIGGGIFNFLTFFLVAKLVGPEKWGVWMIFNIVLKLSPIAQLGVTESVQRQVPILNGQGDWKEGKNLQDTSFTFVLAAGFLLSVLCALVLPLAVEISAINAIILAPILFFNLINFNYGAYFRSNYLFGKAGIISFANGFLSIASLLLTYRYSFEGFIVGQLIRFGLVSIISAWLAKRKIEFNRQFATVKLLVSDGMPVVLISLINYLLMLQDRLVISYFFDIEQLGHYGLAFLLINPLLLVFGAVNAVMYSKLSFDYGEGGRVIALSRLTALSNLQSWVFAFLIGIVYYQLPLIVDKILFDYKPGLSAAEYILLGHVFFFSLGLLNNTFNTLNEQKRRLKVYFINVVLGLVLNLIFLFFYKSIASVALASSLTFLLLFVQLYLALNRIQEKSLHIKGLQLLRQLMVPTGSIIIIIIIKCLIDYQSLVLTTALRSVCFCVVMGVYLYLIIDKGILVKFANEFFFSRR